MHTKPHNILAIIPGTKYLGVAIFVDADLRDWFVKSIPNRSIKEKAEYVKEYLNLVAERFQINVLAIKKLHKSRQSKNLSELAAGIKEAQKKLNVSVREFPLHELEQFLVQGKPNKKKLIEEVAQLYPVVIHEYEREKKNKSRYLTRMFEAIALGIVCFNHIERETTKVAKKCKQS